MRTPDQYQPFSQVRAYRMITFTLVFMAVGTIAELVLLEHYEDQWQLIPILLVGTAIAFFILLKWYSPKALILIFNGLMMGCAVSGFLGIWFHLKANMEFEMELHPSSSGWSLFLDSLAGALPALAPGSMIVFALIGYVYTILILKQPK